MAGGYLNPAEVWPEYFSATASGDETAFPSAGADMTAFRLEEATPESFEADMEALMGGGRVTVREEPDPLMPDPSRGLPDPEWT